MLTGFWPAINAASTLTSIARGASKGHSMLIQIERGFQDCDGRSTIHQRKEASASSLWSTLQGFYGSLGMHFVTDYVVNEGSCTICLWDTPEADESGAEFTRVRFGEGLEALDEHSQFLNDLEDDGFVIQ